MALSETNLTIDDVKSAIGDNSNDVGTLCTSNNINMYSLKKPVYQENNTASEWYKAKDGNYSLTIPSFSYGQTPTDWTYHRPSGGSVEPFDLGHFRGYNHNAEIPLVQPQQSLSFNLWSSSYITFMYMMAPENSAYLNMSDLDYNGIPLDTMYLGAEVIKSGEVTQYLTAQDTIAMGDGVVLDFNQSPFNGWSTGTATVKFFLSKLPRAQGAAEPIANAKCNLPSGSGTYRTCTINITNESVLSETANWVGITTTGTFVSGADTYETPLVSTNKAAWKLTIKNNSASSYTLYDHDLDWLIKPDMDNMNVSIDCNGKMYNTAGTAINSVSIGAGSSTTIVLYYAYALSADGPDDYVTTAFELEHRGSKIASTLATYEASSGAAGGMGGPM
ncbi:hypothetical protein [Carboxylicivirga sp. RSCT41]|uniref:hypothetical protein n=1 Tax=Carboxylicivirga agarovorans TaxID=3417570 RepID=UPI003D33BF74